MMPHHFRMLLVILAFPLAYILGHVAYQEYNTHWRTGQSLPVSKTRVQYPNYHLVALEALTQFRALPEQRQLDIRRNLEDNLVPYEDWLKAFSQQPPRMTCIGENHSDETRRFLATAFFSEFKPDVLMIEATQAQTKSLIEDNRSYVALLGADIKGVLGAQTETAKIIGIDQTPAQSHISREQAILENFATSADLSRSNAVLYGALHCGDFEGWFYDLFLRANRGFKAGQTQHLRIVGEHQDGSLEAFIYFVEEVGLRRNHFVIPTPDRLLPWVKKSFPVLHDQTLKHYGSVVVFRPE